MEYRMMTPIRQEINIIKLHENATIPTYGTEYSAGADLYACLDAPITIEPHTTVKINTGIAVETPEGYFGGIFARSGLATKRGLRPSNCVGVVDSDYRGEVVVALYNDSNEPQVIEPNERVAQMILIPYLQADFKVVDELDTTDRGSGGFGSTGK